MKPTRMPHLSEVWPRCHFLPHLTWLFSFLQFLPSVEHHAHISQAAKFDPSSKIYEISNRWKLASQVQVQKESKESARKKAAEQTGSIHFLATSASQCGCWGGALVHRAACSVVQQTARYSSEQNRHSPALWRLPSTEGQWTINRLTYVVRWQRALRRQR